MTCGCEVGPDFVRPDAPKADHFNDGGDPGKTALASGVEQHFNANADIPADWWHIFGSPDLDTTMKEALARSPTVQAAEATLRVSQDNLRAGQGVFLPQADSGGEATRQKFLPQSVGESTPGKIFNLDTLSGTVSYTLDIFGGERREVEALSAQVDVQRANVLASYLTLSGNLVSTTIARQRIGRK